MRSMLPRQACTRRTDSHLQAAHPPSNIRQVERPASRFESAWATIQAAQPPPFHDPNQSQRQSLQQGLGNRDTVSGADSDHSISELGFSSRQPNDDTFYHSVSLPARIGDSSSADSSSSARQIQSCQAITPDKMHGRAHAGPVQAKVCAIGYSSDSEASCKHSHQQRTRHIKKRMQYRSLSGSDSSGKKASHQQQQQPGEIMPLASGLQPGSQPANRHRKHHPVALTGSSSPRGAKHAAGERPQRTSSRHQTSQQLHSSPLIQQMLVASASNNTQRCANAFGRNPDHTLQPNPVYSPEAFPRGLQIQASAKHGRRSYSRSLTRGDAEVSLGGTGKVNGQGQEMRDNAVFGSPWSSFGSASEMENLTSQALHMSRCSY